MTAPARLHRERAAVTPAACGATSAGASAAGAWTQTVVGSLAVELTELVEECVDGAGGKGALLLLSVGGPPLPPAAAVSVLWV